jgi:hypothetical protein
MLCASVNMNCSNILKTKIERMVNITSSRQPRFAGSACSESSLSENNDPAHAGCHEKNVAAPTSRGSNLLA